MNNRWRILLSLLCGTFWTISAVAHADILVPPSQPLTKDQVVSRLISRSQIIVSGTVTKVEGHMETRSMGTSDVEVPFVISEIDVTVDQHLKGSANKQLKIEVPGGCLHKDDCHYVDFLPRFSEGEKVLLFLRQSPDGTFYLSDPLYGKQKGPVIKIGDYQITFRELVPALKKEETR